MPVPHRVPQAQEQVAGLGVPALRGERGSLGVLEDPPQGGRERLGPRGVRVNLVSAGPIQTLAAGGIEGFDGLAGGWDAQAPLGWDTQDASPVASAVCFLLGAGSRGITGEVLHVDGGYHAMGAPAHA